MSTEAGLTPHPSDPTDRTILLYRAVWIVALAMLVCTAAQSWQLALGFVLLAISSEIGQVIQLLREGGHPTPTMLLPSIGGRRALFSLPLFSGAEDRMALAGLCSGTIGCVIALSLYLVTGSDLFELLAFIGLVINVFRATPMLPSDYLEPSRWGGFVALILAYALVIGVVLTIHSPALVLLATVAGIELIQRRLSFTNLVERHYMLSHRRLRLAVACISLAVAVVLVPDSGSVYAEGGVLSGLT